MLRTNGGLKSQVVEDFGEKFAFLKKRPLAGKFSKFCSERIHRLTNPGLVCKFRPEIGKGVRCLPDKKHRFALSLSLLRG